VYKAFAESNITFCSMSHPTLPDEVIRTSKDVYFRFHGVPHLYTSRYDVAVLEKISQAIQDLSEIGEAHVYFNNTANAAAIDNAKQFQELCEHVSH
jgi:uncharacterized protein YecE (DUF72 family)